MIFSIFRRGTKSKRRADMSNEIDKLKDKVDSLQAQVAALVSVLVLRNDITPSRFRKLYLQNMHGLDQRRAVLRDQQKETEG